MLPTCELGCVALSPRVSWKVVEGFASDLIRRRRGRDLCGQLFRSADLDMGQIMRLDVLHSRDRET